MKAKFFEARNFVPIAKNLPNENWHVEATPENAIFWTWKEEILYEGYKFLEARNFVPISKNLPNEKWHAEATPREHCIPEMK